MAIDPIDRRLRMIQSELTELNSAHYAIVKSYSSGPDMESSGPIEVIKTRLERVEEKMDELRREKAELMKRAEEDNWI
jgi:hypothetical protein